MSLIRARLIADRIRQVPGIEYSHWNSDIGFNSEFTPAFVIQQIQRDWEPDNDDPNCPVYTRDIVYRCFIVYDVYASGADFDALNEKVIEEIRLMIKGCFITDAINNNVDNFEIFRTEIDEIDARVYGFDIILPDQKDYL